MPANNARQTHRQFILYFRKRVNFSDNAIAAGVLFGTLPAGARIVSQAVIAQTGFNAATTNALNVGTTAGGTQVFTDVATIGARQPALPNLAFATDTDLFVAYVQTGTAATTGLADIIIGFVCNNDI